MKTVHQTELTSSAGAGRNLSMKRTSLLLLVLAMAASVIAYMPASGQADEQTNAVSPKEIPEGYRDWKLISVASVGGNVNDLRAKLGNDIAIRAYREDKLPFPDGTIIARLAWRQAGSEENNIAFSRAAQRGGLSPEQTTKLLSESFVAGPAVNVQFMIKDSKKYATTGGWGFAQFDNNGKPANETVHKTCFSCHEPAKARDFVFTRYAP
jgi:hypothetical protein